MRLLHAACELAAIGEGGMTVEDQVKSVGHKYLTPEEVAAIREFYQTLPLDLDSSVLAVRRDFLRLIDDWQVLMAENQRLREHVDRKTARTHELYNDGLRKWQREQELFHQLQEREKKLVEALRFYADERRYQSSWYGMAGDYTKRARDTLKELGIE